MDARQKRADRERVSFSIRIDKDLKELVDAKADAEDRPVASLIRAALRRYVTT